MNCSKCLVFFAIAVMLAGCGGGGSGGGGNGPSAPVIVINPNLTVPLQAALANIVNNGLNKPFTISGWIDNSTLANPNLPHTPITGSGNMTVGAASATTFNGAAALGSTTAITGSVTINGQLTSIASTATTFYNSSNYTVIGTVASNVTMVFAPYTIPANVTAGSTGLLGSGTDGSSFNTTTETQSYTVASGDANSLLITIIYDRYSSMQGHTDQAQIIYRIDTTGNISPVSITALKFYTGNTYQSLTFTF